MSRGTDPRPSETHMRRTRELHDILLPAIREIGRRHGYAIAVHGSLERDIDLVAVPWTEHSTPAASLVEDIYRACEAILGNATGPGGWTEKDKFPPPSGALPNPTHKPHGRLAWAVLFGGGPYIDLSVMPRTDPSGAPPISTTTTEPNGSTGAAAVR